MLRVEGWLSHYRNMGIKHFFVIDNGSTDGTLQFLSGQPDVILQRKDDNFQESKFGITWLNEFRALVGSEKWVIFADADELLVYEGWPMRSIAELVGDWDTSGCNAVFGFMLDMYPDGILNSTESASSSSKDLFVLSPCFDGDYSFQFMPRKPWQRGNSKRLSYVIGGPRVRLISSFERERSVTWVDIFIRGLIDRVLPWTPDLLVPTVVRVFPKTMPALHKVPLTRGGVGVSYLNNHTIQGDVRFYRQNVVLCHFKFMHDFAYRIKTEVERKVHYRKGAEYIMYEDALRKLRVLDFRYSGTQRFKSAAQLLSLGLIREAVFHD
jgi:glycosyltransferase involved in cell wall biosynthesis